MVKPFLLSAMVMLIGACQAPSVMPATPQTPQVPIGADRQGAVIQVRLASGVSLRTLARPMVGTDIDHFVVKLFNAANDALLYTYTTPNANTAVSFSAVPNGGYYITGEAFDATASITKGGAQRSTNTVTVASPNVTYSTGTALNASLPLLDGTGEAFGGSLNVTDGNAYTGPITVTSP